jgi:tetratricopeptide (TPR) repeat protein
LVYFDNGRVVQASIRSRGTDFLPDRAGRSQREVDRQLRAHIERVVFDLMSWSEGFFSFEERLRDEMAVESRVAVSTESLLMEGARRFDEWSRIAEVIPNVGVVPELAPIDPERDGAMLDLLPHEWQVLALIDGTRDLRDIASAIPRDEFEVAKVAYGLTTTGVVRVRSPSEPTPAPVMTSAEVYLRTARAHTKAGRHADALDGLRHAVQQDPLTPRIHLDIGFAAARVGDLAAARASWEHVVRLAADDASEARARKALDALGALERLLDEHAGE